MNVIDMPIRTATSAAGAMRQQMTLGLVLMSGALSSLGTTTSAKVFSPLVHRSLRPLIQTSSGIPMPGFQGAASALLELRRLSGLTWEQLARLFGVDRRSLHFWANGKPLNPGNEERLHRLLATIRKLDRGRASDNRALLLESREGGVIPFDLLTAGRYEEVLTLVGKGTGHSRAKSTPRSAQASANRKPPPPAELVGALQDRAHTDRSRLLSATPIQRKREK
jgi:transcriptional regulator with XRE-family HTH domain